jgi:hypothetical protein
MKIIKIELIVAGFLGSSKSTKNGPEIIKREYINPITVREVLTDAKIKLRFIGLIMLNGKNTNQDFLINHSCRIKLYPLLGGG